MAFDPDIYLESKLKTSIAKKKPLGESFNPDAFLAERKTTVTDREKGMKMPGFLSKKGIFARAGTQFLAGQEKTEREITELLGGKKLLRKPRIDIPKPTGFIEKTAKIGGEYLAPQPILMGVPGVAKSIQPAAKKLSMLTGKAVRPITKLVGKKLSKPLKKLGKVSAKGISFAGEMLSGVNRKFFERAVTKEAAGKSIFKGKWQPSVYNELGKKAQKAVKWIEKEAGKEVGEAKDIVKKATKFARTKKYADKIDDLVSKSKFGKIQTLNKSDLNNINSLKGLIRSAKTTQELQGVKELAQGMTKYGSETVAKSSSRGQSIIKEIARDLAKDIADAVPKLKGANVKFSEIKTLKKALLTELKDKSIARNLKNITTKSDYVKNLFKQLDELAPNEVKFMEKLDDSIAREAFEKIFPGKGGGSGSAEGFANLLRIGSVGTVAPYALPALSPKIQKLLIKATGKTPKALQRILTKTPLTRKPLVKAGLKIKKEIKE